MNRENGERVSGYFEHLKFVDPRFRYTFVPLPTKKIDYPSQQWRRQYRDFDLDEKGQEGWEKMEILLRFYNRHGSFNGSLRDPQKQIALIRLIGAGYDEVSIGKALGRKGRSNVTGVTKNVFGYLLPFTSDLNGSFKACYDMLPPNVAHAVDMYSTYSLFPEALSSLEDSDTSVEKFMYENPHYGYLMSMLALGHTHWDIRNVWGIKNVGRPTCESFIWDLNRSIFTGKSPTRSPSRLLRGIPFSNFSKTQESWNGYPASAVLLKSLVEVARGPKGCNNNLSRLKCFVDMLPALDYLLLGKDYKENRNILLEMFGIAKEGRANFFNVNGADYLESHIIRGVNKDFFANIPYSLETIIRKVGEGESVASISRWIYDLLSLQVPKDVVLPAYSFAALSNAVDSGVVFMESIILLANRFSINIENKNIYVTEKFLQEVLQRKTAESKLSSITFKLCNKVREFSQIHGKMVK